MEDQADIFKRQLANLIKQRIGNVPMSKESHRWCDNIIDEIVFKEINFGDKTDKK